MNELVQIKQSYSQGELTIKADKLAKRIEVILSESGISISKVIVETKDEVVETRDELQREG